VGPDDLVVLDVGLEEPVLLEDDLLEGVGEVERGTTGVQDQLDVDAAFARDPQDDVQEDGNIAGEPAAEVLTRVELPISVGGGDEDPQALREPDEESYLDAHGDADQAPAPAVQTAGLDEVDGDELEEPTPEPIEPAQPEEQYLGGHGESQQSPDVDVHSEFASEEQEQEGAASMFIEDRHPEERYFEGHGEVEQSPEQGRSRDEL
jgi:hypothetical protein